MKCPECGGKVVNGTCESCGYKMKPSKKSGKKLKKALKSKVAERKLFKKK